MWARNLTREKFSEGLLSLGAGPSMSGTGAGSRLVCGFRPLPSPEHQQFSTSRSRWNNSNSNHDDNVVVVVVISHQFLNS